MKRKILTQFFTLTLTCFLLIGCAASDTSETPSTASESSAGSVTTDAPETVDATATTDTSESTDETAATDVSKADDETAATDASETVDESATDGTSEPTDGSTDIATENTMDDTTKASSAEASEPLLTPEPVPEPVAVYTYTDMAQTMYAKSTVNVRDLPDTSGNKLGSLSAGQEVAVTGVCNETSWYKIDYNGVVAFVSNDYLVAEKPVAPAKATSSGGMTRNIADYRQISSMSELTPALGWSVDFAGFCANYKNIPKVAYTYNGVTILLFDYTWNDGYGDWCVFYDFSRSHTSSPWSRQYQSNVHSIIDAGGYETYSFNLDGSKVYTWHPISDYQVY